MSIMPSADAPQTVQDETIQSFRAPAWMVRAIALRLRAVSPRGGLYPAQPPTLNVFAAQTAASFR